MIPTTGTVKLLRFSVIVITPGRLNVQFEVTINEEFYFLTAFVILGDLNKESLKILAVFEQSLMITERNDDPRMLGHIRLFANKLPLDLLAFDLREKSFLLAWFDDPDEDNFLKKGNGTLFSALIGPTSVFGLTDLVDIEIDYILEMD